MDKLRFAETLIDLDDNMPKGLSECEKYGYDPKQLHHIIRMNDFIQYYAQGVPFKDCLISQKREYLINIKKGILSEEKATILAEKTDTDTANFMKRNLKEKDEINPEALRILDEVKYNVLKEKFREDLENKENE